MNSMNDSLVAMRKVYTRAGLSGEMLADLYLDNGVAEKPGARNRPAVRWKGIDKKLSAIPTGRYSKLQTKQAISGEDFGARGNRVVFSAGMPAFLWRPRAVGLSGGSPFVCCKTCYLFENNEKFMSLSH
jgi:hypothetical protein